MAEHCPSCGGKRNNSGEECEYCGAYVTKWEERPILTSYMADKEDVPESNARTFLEKIFRIEHLLKLMMLAGLLVIFLILSLCSALEKL